MTVADVAVAVALFAALNATGAVERGAVCLALYPFTFGFPLETVQRDAESELLDANEHADIEQIEKTIAAGDVPEVITKIKLRRVLLIQTGTHPGMHDVMVARVTSVSDSMRARAGFYGRLTGDRHPTALLLGGRPEHGTGRREAYVNLVNVSPIPRPPSCGASAAWMTTRCAR